MKDAMLGHAIAAEWIKLRSLRSSTGLLLAMATSILGVAVFVGATESLQPGDTVLGGSVGGAAAAQLVVGTLGVLAVSAEFSTGTIRTTLAAIPRRSPVLAAKAVVVAVAGFAIALAACPLAYVLGRMLLAGKGYAPGTPMPALVGVALSVALTGVLGHAIGTIVRHTGGGIAAILAIVLAPALFGPLFGDFQRWIVGASPMTVLQKLGQSSDANSDTAGSLGAWPSLGLYAAYTAALLVVGAGLFRHRDP